MAEVDRVREAARDKLAMVLCSLHDPLAELNTLAPCWTHKAEADRVLASGVVVLAGDVAARVREAQEAGVRQAMTWLRADYPYGDGPNWRESGAEWIAQCLAKQTAANADPPAPRGDAEGSAT